jgi:hypothetical protein
VRRSRLRVDPAKTAAFHQRGRAQGLDRGKGLKREAPLERGAPLERRSRLRARVARQGAVTPPDVWAAVLRRDGRRCVWCRLAGRDVPAEHPHHLLPKGSGSWPELAGVVENVVALCAACHMTHEFSPCDRLPWAALPRACRSFLVKRAAVDERAARLVVTKYPADAGAPSDHSVRRT